MRDGSQRTDAEVDLGTGGEGHEEGGVSYKLSRGKRAALLRCLEVTERRLIRNGYDPDEQVASARLQGAYARRAGSTTQRCPYAAKGAVRDAWLAGWRDENVRLKHHLRHPWRAA